MRNRCAPPRLRFVEIRAWRHKIALYCAISITFLSYPTYVLLNLDNLRPKIDNELNPDVQAQIDAIRASRK
ncbi:hypothetical protein RB195_011938 [Necator americanus]